MYLVLRENILKNILRGAIKKGKTWRKLAKLTGIPKSTLFAYYQEQRYISEINIQKIEYFTKKKIDQKSIIKKIPDNWKQLKGGHNCYAKKKREGSLYSQLAEARKHAKNAVSKWHKYMKKEHPIEYYNSQYEKFKKIGGYKYITKNGEKVRNLLEKDTANKLAELGLPYQYEPLVRIENHVFFPDFLVNNRWIIECTAWRGQDKAIKLKEKISFLEKKYKVNVLIPKALYNYYQMLDEYLIYEIDKTS